METAQNTPEFIIVQNDAVVLMDMQDLILREFQRLPLCLDDLDALIDLLSGIDGPAVVIANCDPEEYIKTVLARVRETTRHAVILISDAKEYMPHLADGLSVVPAPFSYETLLASITNAFSHLHSSRI